MVLYFVSTGTALYVGLGLKVGLYMGNGVIWDLVSWSQTALSKTCYPTEMMLFALQCWPVWEHAVSCFHSCHSLDVANTRCCFFFFCMFEEMFLYHSLNLDHIIRWLFWFCLYIFTHCLSLIFKSRRGKVTVIILELWLHLLWKGKLSWRNTNFQALMLCVFV